MTSSPATAQRRWAWAEIDLAAIEHNVHELRRAAQPAAVWAVVKADGYGHGAVGVARRAVGAGAEGLCVALVAEGVELRDAGIDAPILVLSEQPVEQLAELTRHRLTPTVYTEAYVDALASQGSSGLPVHLKIDTGMHRVGAPASGAMALARHVARHAPALRLAGVSTHLACADEPWSSATDEQLAAFEQVLSELDAHGSRPPLVHAANSAAALAVPAARYDLARVGIAMYGIAPGAGVAHLCRDLRPAMSLRARVSHVKPVVAGSHVSYGWKHRFDRDTTVATVPIGYADGVPRRLGTLPDRSGADVLIGGRRHPIVGVVTMDQLMVDVDGAEVRVGDEVVLIGEQGDDRIRAEDWADRLGTIGYEIVCGIGPRVPRIVRDRG
jgi:alanine racemase